MSLWLHSLVEEILHFLSFLCYMRYFGLWLWLSTSSLAYNINTYSFAVILILAIRQRTYVLSRPSFYHLVTVGIWAFNFVERLDHHQRFFDRVTEYLRPNNVKLAFCFLCFHKYAAASLPTWSLAINVNLLNREGQFKPHSNVSQCHFEPRDSGPYCNSNGTLKGMDER